MRLQLRILLVSAAVLAVHSMAVDVALGQDTISVRGAYYKERATRVVQPMLDSQFTAGESGRVQIHGLVDAITSASAASGAADTAFTETRVEGGAGYVHEFENLRLGGNLRYSTEPDYQSRFLSANAELDLAEKNATLGLSVVQGFDNIDNSGAQGGLGSIRRGKLHTSMFVVSASQILTRHSLVTASYDLSYLSGFQQNMYRTVAAGGQIELERLPDRRLRHALAANYKHLLSSTNTIVIAGYRFYADDWGIVGNAPELRMVQEMLDGDLEVHGQYRYYRQQRADFYKPVYDTADPNIEPYLAADDKYGTVRTHTLGGKAILSLGRLGFSEKWERTRVEAQLQYFWQNTHYGNAIVSHLALTHPLD